MISPMMVTYLLTIVFSAIVIVAAAVRMCKDVTAVSKGNLDIAFVAACGFCVFPFLNVPTAVWLLFEVIG